MKRVLLCISIVFALVASHCSNTKHIASETEFLFRNKWQPYEIFGQAMPGASKTSLEFTPGTLSGNTGCNQMSAGFTPGKHYSIKFTPQMLTKMACPDEEAANLEKKLLEALSAANKWNISNDELWLSDGSGPVIKLRAVK